MQLKVVFKMIGRLLVVLGLGMLLPLVVGLYYGEKDAFVFLICVPFTVFSGFLLSRLCQTDKNIRTKDGFAIATYGWLLASFFGMLPYLLSGSVHGVLNAYFETMAGFSTTGCSIIDDVEVLSHSILLWRSMTQWFGGMGILVLFVALLSSASGSSQLYRAEMPGIVTEKLTPRISDNAKIMWLIYLILTLGSFIVFVFCGMPLFDALCHAFTTVSTGGFSIKNASLGYYQSNALENAVTLFMFLSAINFAVYYRTFFSQQKLKTFFKTTEVRAYFIISLIFAALISFDLFINGDFSLLDSLQKGTFQIISIITTTGFVISDFELWPSFSLALIIIAFFCGGCSSSTSCSIKIDRYVILFRQAYADIQRYLHPRLVTRQKINNNVIPETIVISVGTFFFLMLFLVAVSTLIFAFLGLNLLESFTVAASTLCNIGLSVDTFGPTESYAAMPVFGKVWMIVLMLLGRLEIYTVLAVLVPSKLKSRKK